MPADEPTLVEGTFEYIEAKIRRDAEGTAFGGDFEWLCQWFLLHAPRYRGQFEKVWLWNEWPERPSHLGEDPPQRPDRAGFGKATIEEIEIGERSGDRFRRPGRSHRRSCEPLHG